MNVEQCFCPDGLPSCKVNVYIWPGTGWVTAESHDKQEVKCGQITPLSQRGSFFLSTKDIHIRYLCTDFMRLE